MPDVYHSWETHPPQSGQVCNPRNGRGWESQTGSLGTRNSDVSFSSPLKKTKREWKLENNVQDKWVLGHDSHPHNVYPFAFN